MSLSAGGFLHRAQLHPQPLAAAPSIFGARSSQRPVVSGVCTGAVLLAGVVIPHAFHQWAGVCYSALNCLDSPGPDFAGIRAEAARFEMTSATFGLATLTGLLTCAHWPVQTQPRMSALRGAGAAPILVVGTTGDPATPYAWAEALASQLASGVLLTYEGEGHTAYLRSVPCIDDAIDAYLIEGKLPEDGTRCGGSDAAAAIMFPAMRGPRPAPRQFLPPRID